MLPGPVTMSTGANSDPSVSIPPYANNATAWAPPTAHTSSTPRRAAAARIVGCGRPSNCACGGLAMTRRVHAGGLGGHDVHHHAGRVDGVAAGHVEPDPFDRHPALGHRGAGRERRRGVGAPLVGVHRAGALDRHLERGADVGRQPIEGVLQVAGRHPNLRRAAPRRTTRRTPGRPRHRARRPRRRSDGPSAAPHPRPRHREAAPSAAAQPTGRRRAGRCGPSSEPNRRRHPNPVTMRSRIYCPRTGQIDIATAGAPRPGSSEGGAYLHRLVIVTLAASASFKRPA